jgi:predicted nucleic acid-binding protein
VFAAAKATGRSTRTRLANLLIAATAAANSLPPYTCRLGDFARLDVVVSVRQV